MNSTFPARPLPRKLINEWLRLEVPPVSSALLLIITSDDLKGALIPFMRHKQNIGTPAIVASMTMIKRDVIGVDDAERVKRLIFAARTQLGVRYVLLAGDAQPGHVPTRFVCVVQPSSPNLDIKQSYNIADHYFSNLYLKPSNQSFASWQSTNPIRGFFNRQLWLTSPWEYNPDNVDGYPSIAVGRVPAAVFSDLSNFVSKVIEYETVEMPRGRPYTFAASGNYPGSTALADSIAISVKSSATLRVGVALRGSMPNGWVSGTQSDFIAACRKSSWIFSVSHGSPKMIEDLASFSDATSKDFGGVNFPIFATAACDTGQFTSNLPWFNATSAAYRDINGVIHQYNKSADETRTLLDSRTGANLTKPVDLPPPDPYDLECPAGGRSMASPFLFATRPDGKPMGMVAYIGETITMDNERSTEFLTYLAAKTRGDGYQRLGDAWQSAQKQYWSVHYDHHVHGTKEFAHPRIYLSSSILFGDPSMRLNRSTAFSRMAGAAKDIAIASNGTFWAVGTNPVGSQGDFGIHRYDGSRWQSVRGGGLKIAIGTDWFPWIVNSKGNIYRYSASEWEQVPGAARDIGIGAEGSVWVIGTDKVSEGDFGIHRRHGGAWESVDGGGVKISVDRQGNPWVVNAKGEIFQRTDNAWKKLPGLASDIGIGRDGSVWIIGTNTVGQHGDFGVFVLRGNKWKSVEGGGVRISVGPNGTPWIVNSQNQIFSLDAV